MPLVGTCQICHKISRALSICVYCGKKVCIECIDSRTIVCKECQNKMKK